MQKAILIFSVCITAVFVSMTALYITQNPKVKAAVAHEPKKQLVLDMPEGLLNITDKTDTMLVYRVNDTMFFYFKK